LRWFANTGFRVPDLLAITLSVAGAVIFWGICAATCRADFWLREQGSRRPAENRMSRTGDPTANVVAALARRLITRYAWQSVTEEWIVERVLQWIAETPPPLPRLADRDRWLEGLAEQAAGEALYRACSLTPGAPPTADEAAQMRQGYTDLGNYLFAIAATLPEPAAGLERADLVQMTLAAVYAHIAECRQPRTFLAWAAQILRNQQRGNWRRARHEISWPADAEAGDAGGAAARLGPRDANPEGDQDVLRILRRCLDSDEERTLALCFTFGLKRRELGMVFERPLAYFDELGRKVKRKLRQCPEFQALLVGEPAGSFGS
jgi:DNA-directed RNA polymerase specialized sigma24 family protein